MVANRTTPLKAIGRPPGSGWSAPAAPPTRPHLAQPGVVVV